MRLLNEKDAIWAADQFIDYYSNFNRIDDYMRFVKQSRMLNSLGRLFGPEDEIFSDFSIHPSEMSFTIHEVDTSLKPKTKYNQDLYSEVLNITASNAIEEAIPGRTIKWMVTEDTTKKVIGVVRFGSPTINSKPRNDYFGEVLPLSKINHEFVMGFNIVPVQPFGYNYLGGKLLAALCCSHEVREKLNKKYGMNLVMFETTSLYGNSKSASQYDGMKPFLKNRGLTVSDFIPMLNGQPYLNLVKYVEDIVGKGELVPESASSRKLKMTNAIIGLLKRSLVGEDLDNFKNTINNAKQLTEQKRYYVSNYGIENYIDIVNGKTDKIVAASNFDRYTQDELIKWWKSLATKRYNKLKEEDRLRSDLEVWTENSQIDIIR